MASSIENIVFDMGNVLMGFDGHAFARHFCDNDADGELLWQAYFGRAEWALTDAGVIGLDTLERVARADIPERLWPNLAECHRTWPQLLKPIEGTNELVVRLKERGLGVYLLSNAGVYVEQILANMPANKYMDGRVISSFERLMKPDPSIFQLACMRFGIDPATVLFVDDNAANCEGARIAGMRAFHFTGDIDELAAVIDRETC